MSTVASKGLEGVVAAETELSFIDGEKGVLEYVGIDIDSLARHSTFEETVFLLWNKRLPRKNELGHSMQENPWFRFQLSFHRIPLSSTTSNCQD